MIDKKKRGENKERRGKEKEYKTTKVNWYKEECGDGSMEVAKTIATFLRGKNKLQLENLLRGPPKKNDWSTNARDCTPFSAGNIKANAFRNT